MELKFLVLLAIAAGVSAEDTFCKPRALFKMDCNTCTCSIDGKRAACTQKACPVDPSLEPDPVEESAQVCSPGTKFNDYCNTCGCSSDGLSFVCTKMLCDKNVWNKDGSFKKTEKSDRVTRSATEQVCQPGTKFNDYCNICGCASDGSSFICTKMLCDKNVWNVDGSLKLTKSELKARSESNEVCEPGSKFNDYCNTCGCASDGSSFICTKMLCNKNLWNKDGTLKPHVKSERNVKSVSNHVCEPGTKFNEYCNTCGCATDGSSFICTKMLCDKNVWNKNGTVKAAFDSERSRRSVKAQVCEPSKKYKDYCNSCTCSEDGTSSICTQILCDKNFWNKDGTTKAKESSDETTKSVTAQVCEPNKKYKDYCNSCTCSADGTTSICTQIWCDKNFWNKDGTPKVNVSPDETTKSDVANKVCEPGKSFQPDSCNTCKCGPDGVRYACTFKICTRK